MLAWERILWKTRLTNTESAVNVLPNGAEKDSDADLESMRKQFFTLAAEIRHELQTMIAEAPSASENDEYEQQVEDEGHAEVRIGRPHFY